MPLIDHGGLSDTGVSRDKHQLRLAASNDAIKSGEKGIDLAVSPVQPLGSHEAIGSVMIARHEIVDAPLRSPFVEAASQVAFNTRRRLISVLDGLGEELHRDCTD